MVLDVGGRGGEEGELLPVDAAAHIKHLTAKYTIAYVHV